METSNLVLAFLAMAIATLVFGIEWLLSFRGRVQRRPMPHFPYATSTPDYQSEDLKGADST